MSNRLHVMPNKLLKPTFFLYLTLCLIGFSAPPALAQNDLFTGGVTLERQIEICSMTTSRVTRLICYDDLASRLGYVTPEIAQREEEILERYGFWEVTRRMSAAGEQIYYLKNDAAEYVVSRSGTRRKPTFMISCRNGETEAYLDWKDELLRTVFASRGARNTPYRIEMIYQMGTEPRYRENWDMSTDLQAAFVPDAIEFIRDLRQHNRLVLNFTPTGESLQTIVHELSGMNDALRLLVELCYQQESE